MTRHGHSCTFWSNIMRHVRCQDLIELPRSRWSCDGPRQYSHVSLTHLAFETKRRLLRLASSISESDHSCKGLRRRVSQVCVKSPNALLDCCVRFSPRFLVVLCVLIGMWQHWVVAWEPCFFGVPPCPKWKDFLSRPSCRPHLFLCPAPWSSRRLLLLFCRVFFGNLCNRWFMLCVRLPLGVSLRLHLFDIRGLLFFYRFARSLHLFFLW